MSKFLLLKWFDIVLDDGDKPSTPSHKTLRFKALAYCGKLKSKMNIKDYQGYLQKFKCFPVSLIRLPFYYQAPCTHHPQKLSFLARLSEKSRAVNRECQHVWATSGDSTCTWTVKNLWTASFLQVPISLWKKQKNNIWIQETVQICPNCTFTLCQPWMIDHRSQKMWTDRSQVSRSFYRLSHIGFHLFL